MKMLSRDKLNTLKKAAYLILQELEVGESSDKADYQRTEPAKCNGCGNLRIFFHDHHIVPKSVGGLDEPSNIITICEECHAKVHQRSQVNLSSLIKAGLEKAKSEGKRIGAPPMAESLKEDVRRLRASGKSIRRIAKEVNISPSSVERALRGTRNPSPKSD